MKDRIFQSIVRAGMSLAVILVASHGRAADPQVMQCISANELAIRARGEARLLEAREKLIACASLSCPGEIRAECERRLRDLNAAIPTVVFEVRDASGNDLANVHVSVDGKPLAERLDGTAISLDPGAHTFRFEMNDRAPVEKSLTLREGEKARRESIVLGMTTQPATRPAAAPPAGGTAASSPSSPLRTAGWWIAGAGAAGLVAGAVTGGLAIADKGQANCDSQGYNCQDSALSNAKTMAGISTGAFIAGSVLTAAGLGLILFAPNGAARAELATGPGVVGVTVGGAF
jgi:hypothetical protein